MQAPRPRGDGRLSAEEEQDLAVKWQQNRDGDALVRLLQSVAPALRAIARRIDPQGGLREDLIAEGNLAVLEHLPNYKPMPGVRPFTYLQYFVAPAMAEFRNNAKNLHRGDDGPATRQRMCSLDEVSEAMLVCTAPSSVSQVISRENTRNARSILEAGLQRLNPDERDVMVRRRNDETDTDLISHIGCANRLRHLERAAMQKMRHAILRSGVCVEGVFNNMEFS